MKLMRVGAPGAEKPAMMAPDGTIRDLSGVVHDFTADVLSAEGLHRLAALDPASLPVAAPGRVGPCVPRPMNFVCIGLNYADHAAETGAAIPKEPIIFLKSLGAFQGPNDDVHIPRGSKKTDWEVELAIVIGKKASYVPENAAMELRRRILRGERRERARIPDRARRHLGQGQGLRHLRPHRPLAGHEG